jgi:hypothetical protein
MTPTAIEKEQVFVRHVDEKKRDDIRHIGSLLKAPFPGRSGGSCSDGGSEDVTIVGYTPGRSMVAARFAEHAWAPLYSNAAGAEGMFQANARHRRLEVVWLGFRLGVGWFFKLNRAGKRVVEFAQGVETDSPSVCKLSGVEPNVLKAGESAEQAVARLCEHFEINRRMPEVRIREDNGLEVIDLEGRPSTSGLRGYVRVESPLIAEGENDAATALAMAIESCDPDGVRAAIGQGAPLNALPGTASTPLQTALFKFDNPRWKECVELLIELGCPVDGVAKEPPIVECVSHLVNDACALKALQLLLAHGADVNATDRQGRTALCDCAAQGRTNLIRFLLERGADRNIKDQQGLSAVDWARRRYETESSFTKRTQLAEPLSLLTGEPVAKPQPMPLSPELAAESQRFKSCLLARKILASPTMEIKLHQRDASPLARYRWFPDWERGFLDEGFQLAGHFVVGVAGRSAYSNPELAFEAVLSVRGDRPSCEIAAYHPDGTVTLVGNLPPLTSADFTSQFIHRTEITDASPAQLVEHLRGLVCHKELTHRFDADSFVRRYTDLLNRLVAETRERAQQILDTPTILVNGKPPRYERLGCYLDFIAAGFDDPGYSTESWMGNFKEDFAKADGNPPSSTGNAVDAAMYLATMSHLQFASAIDPSEFLARASDVALVHFQTLASATTWCSEAEPWFQFRALLRGLLLCALAGRWETFKQLCNLVKPELASANIAGEDDLDFAQVLLLLVSDCRDSALEKAASLERSVAKRLAKPPRLLLEIWGAIRAGQISRLEEALRASLDHFAGLRPDKIGPKGSNEVYRVVPLPESLFHMAARHRGLTLPALPAPYGDMLITPESLRAR